MDLMGIPANVMLVVTLALLAVKLFAFINSLLWTGEHYRAADKWSKGGWATVLGIALVLQVVPVVPSVVNLGLTIAAFVYLADVRPAMAGLRRR